MVASVGTPPGKKAERGAFRDGFLAMVPLWMGAIPSGVAFGAAAAGSGMSSRDAQLMSLTVFSAAAQMSAVAGGAADGSLLLAVVTALALNAHLPLLGAAIARDSTPSWGERLSLAWVLTDGAFAVAAGRGRLLAPVVLGAGASMYVAWNVGTAAGLIAGEALPGSWLAEIDLVVPLTFVAVLAPLLRTRKALAVALTSGIAALLCGVVVPAGVALLAAGALGALLGAWQAGDE